MPKPSLSNSSIIKVSMESSIESIDLVAVEEPLEIRIGYGNAENRQQKNISVTMRTPGHDFELALGFLFTEGVITKKEDVILIKYCSEVNTIENNENIVRVELNEDVSVDFKKVERNFYTTSSCGVCGKASIEAVKTVCSTIAERKTLLIEKELLFLLPNKLRAKQNIFEYTGGIHASALFDLKGELLFLREDVGRHNALDKLIGASIGSGLLPLDHCVLLLSGRASFELIQKSAIAGIKIVCAVGAPSSLAVETAKEFNITLIGFLRDKKFNIYSNPDRII
jgi:FdhD protein